MLNMKKRLAQAKPPIQEWLREALDEFKLNVAPGANIQDDVAVCADHSIKSYVGGVLKPKIPKILKDSKKQQGSDGPLVPGVVTVVSFLLVKASNKMSSKLVVPAVRKVETKAKTMIEKKMNKDGPNLNKNFVVHSLSPNEEEEEKAKKSEEKNYSVSLDDDLTQHESASRENSRQRAKAVTLDSVVSNDDVSNDSDPAARSMSTEDLAHGTSSSTPENLGMSSKLAAKESEMQKEDKAAGGGANQNFEGVVQSLTTDKETQKKMRTLNEQLHIISRKGLEMEPAKIQKILDIDPKSINTLERVRSFVGLCSYYRRFVKGFHFQNFAQVFWFFCFFNPPE